MKAVRVYFAALSVKSPTERVLSLKLKDEHGAVFAGRTRLEIVAFDTAGLVAPSLDATFGTAIRGTILAGSGLAALELETDDAGWFSCVLTKPAPGSVWITCANTYGGPVVESSDTLEITF